MLRPVEREAAPHSPAVPEEEAEEALNIPEAEEEVLNTPVAAAPEALEPEERLDFVAPVRRLPLPDRMMGRTSHRLVPDFHNFHKMP